MVACVLISDIKVSWTRSLHPKVTLRIPCEPFTQLVGRGPAGHRARCWPVRDPMCSRSCGQAGTPRRGYGGGFEVWLSLTAADWGASSWLLQRAGVEGYRWQTCGQGVGTVTGGEEPASRVMGPRPILAPTPLPGRRGGPGQGGQNACSVLRHQGVSRREEEGKGQLTVTRGRQELWVPVGLQCGTRLSLSLNLPTIPGGQDCQSHFTDGETEALGPSSSSCLTGRWVCVLGTGGKGIGGTGSSLSLSGTL